MTEIRRRPARRARRDAARHLVPGLLLDVAPGDPISFLLQGRSPSPAAVAAVKAQYGLDQPFILQYLHWLGGVLHGDFGRSLEFRQDVGSLILARLPTTLALVGMSAVIILVIGLGAGIIGALRAGRFADKSVLVGDRARGGAVVRRGHPADIGVRGAAGVVPDVRLRVGLTDKIYHLTLLVIALSLTFVALLGRVTRSSMLDQLGREHVEVAVSRGIPYPTVVRRHTCCATRSVRSRRSPGCWSPACS